MNIRNLYRVFLVFFLIPWTLFCANDINAAERDADGDWSGEAISINSLEKIEIPSPDRKKIVVVDGVNLDVIVDGRRLQGLEEKGVMQPAELVWSPDSVAFFITETDGGWVGTWHAMVYIIKNGYIHYYNVTQEVIKQFKKQYKCMDPEEPNVGAVTWLKGSKNLLLVAEVPPHSTCPEMGKIRGYIVEIPTGKVIKEFSKKELQARWGKNLGQRLVK